MKDLVGERGLGLDLGRDIPRDPERADYLPELVAKRHLACRDPGVGRVGEGLSLELADDRLAGRDDALFILESRTGMLMAEEVEIGLPDDLLRGAARRDGVEPTCADEEKLAERVLEVDTFLAR